jgi:drug/metabolite transporter (DMT)-like permease
MRFSPRTAGWVAAGVTVVTWTAFILVARASVHRSLTPFDLSFLRFCGAAAVLLPWGRRLARADRAAGAVSSTSLGGLSPLPLRPTLAMGLVGGLAYGLLAYAGFFFAPAAHAAVLLPGSLPLWTALLAWAALGDRIGRGRAVGLALIVAGDLLVGGASLLQAFSGGSVWKGDLLFMCAAMSWAVYSVLVRRHRADAVRATIAIVAFAFCSYVPLYAALAATGAVPSRLGAAPGSEIAFQLLFQGVLAVAVAGIAFTRMVQAFGPVRSTMITSLVPALAALGAVLLLGESLGWNQVAGLLLVTGGIVFGVRSAAGAPAPATIPAESNAPETIAAGPHSALGRG